MSVIARWAFAAYARRRTPGWRERLTEVRRLASLPAGEFATWQVDAVRDHLAWARASVPWFRKRIPEGARLEDLPILTRRDVQENRDALRDWTRLPETLEAEASGGSTGEPVRLWTDRAAVTWTFATDAHVLDTLGVPPWCPTAVLWGDDRDRARLSWRERLEERLLGVRVLNAFGMDDARMEAFATDLARRPPTLLRGYARALDLFADFLRRRPDLVVRPRVILSAAEALSPEVRARVSEAFGCPVRDFYGSRESPSLAAECLHGGFHVLAHGRVLEIVNADGKAVPAGVPGAVLVTDLTNRAFGLIRYANGDVASWSPDPAPCPCGSPYPRLERVLGRTSDFLTLPTGERVHGEWFTHLFYGVEGVTRFQVRQPDRPTIEVLTVGSAGETTMAPILSRIRTRVGPGVSVTWRRVEEIPPTRSGKHRFTVSSVPYLTGTS